MRRYLEHFLDLCKNRIFVMLCGVIVLFAIIVLRLFSLQIIHGEYYDESITASVSKTLPVAASRGNIYDRYGRPLAVNTVYSGRALCTQIAAVGSMKCMRSSVGFSIL
jgi:penicillin-binding protein 2